MPGRYHPFRHVNLLVVCAEEPLTAREARDRLAEVEGGFRVGVSTVQMMIARYVRDGLLIAIRTERQYSRDVRPTREYTLSSDGEAELEALLVNLKAGLSSD